MPHCRNIYKVNRKNKKYHTVGTFTKVNCGWEHLQKSTDKNTTLSEHLQSQQKKQKIPHRRNI